MAPGSSLRGKRSRRDPVRPDAPPANPRNKSRSSTLKALFRQRLGKRARGAHRGRSPCDGPRERCEHAKMPSIGTAIGGRSSPDRPTCARFSREPSLRRPPYVLVRAGALPVGRGHAHGLPGRAGPEFATIGQPMPFDCMSNPVVSAPYRTAFAMPRASSPAMRSGSGRGCRPRSQPKCFPDRVFL